VPSVIRRGPVTTRVIQELKEEGLPVGDNQAPEDAYGWQGEPGAETSNFIPWMSVGTLTGQPQRPNGGLGDTGTEWMLPYEVFYAGLSRKHVEALADKMRAALVNIERELITTSTGDWKIQKLACTTVGRVNRIGSTFPDYFTQVDTFELLVSKGR